MSTINASSKEILVKIVYYGPGLCGKTTSLQAIHARLPQDKRPELVSVSTEEDRTLFFDFLPVNAATLGPYTVRLLMYTVPGQVYYNSTRKLVLSGADGVVFVADSQPDRRSANLESFNNLKANLAEWGFFLSELPHVLQFNKRDLPGAMSTEQMNEELNEFDMPWFETVASKGEGVDEAMRVITRQVIRAVQKQSTKKAGAAPSPKTTSTPPPPAAKPSAGGSIASSIVQTLPEPPEPAAAVAEPPPVFSVAACWPDNISRREAEGIESLITAGKFGEAVVKSAQLMDLISHREGHDRSQEAIFALLHGVSGGHYLRYRRCVSQALRGEALTLPDAVSVYLLVTHIAIDH